MATDWWARGLGVASVALSLTTLGWSIVSWVRGGARLRVNALAYGECLRIRIFNDGRGPATIEQAVLGGARGGLGGSDLTRQLQLPVTLEPGQSFSCDVPMQVLSSRRALAVAAGWESLWLLLGSMRQRRAEVLPVQAALPPRSGWRLAPPRAKWSRFRPLGAAVLAVAALPGPGNTSDGGAHTGLSTVNKFALALLVLWSLGALYRTVVFPAWESRRRNIERRLVYAATAVGALRVAGAIDPRWSHRILEVLLLVGLVLAWPGAVGLLREQGYALRTLGGLDLTRSGGHGVLGDGLLFELCG